MIGDPRKISVNIFFSFYPVLTGYKISIFISVCFPEKKKGSMGFYTTPALKKLVLLTWELNDSYKIDMNGNQTLGEAEGHYKLTSYHLAATIPYK